MTEAAPQGTPAGGTPAGGNSGAAPASGAPAADTGATPPAPSTVVAPWSNSQEVYKLGEGDKAVPWFETITEAPVRDLMRTKGYKNPAEVAMAYHNLNKLQNNAPDVLTVPKAEDTDGWNKLYTKLGRPNSPNDYDLKPMTEGIPHDPKMVNFGKELFHKLGVPASKAQEAINMWDAHIKGMLGETQEAARVKNEGELNALTTKWGPELEANKAAGLRVLNALGPKAADLVKRVEGHIGSAAIVELLAEIGRRTDEGGFKGSGTNSGDPNDPSGMSKQQIEAKIKELQGSKDFTDKYNNAKHPEHKAALAQMERLFAALK